MRHEQPWVAFKTLRHGHNTIEQVHRYQSYQHRELDRFTADHGHRCHMLGGTYPETVVISVDMANAFNSIHRAAMLAAVQQSAPALLPMVQWAYGDETPLHIVGAPEGTPPVMSQRRVRQGDPLGPLLFAFTLQPVLERVDAACEEAPLVAYLDDMSITTRMATGSKGIQKDRSETAKGLYKEG